MPPATAPDPALEFPGIASAVIDSAEISPGPVLEFWFDAAPGAAHYGRMRDVWFEKSDAFDDEVRARLGASHDAAVAGTLDAWIALPRASLALVILLDQVPRNIFRGTPRAFASDAQARAVARAAVERGHDRDLLPNERLFLYLPFEHSEILADQERALELFRPLAAFADTANIMASAQRHRDIVARFGRFPHRNAILGRGTTAEEAAFLKEPKSAF
jgi:uncharacterized protein (DUF924 family)